jgi:hypothetical protein
MAEPEPEAAAAEWVDGSGLAAEEVAEQLIGRQVDIEGVGVGTVMGCELFSARG